MEAEKVGEKTELSTQLEIFMKMKKVFMKMKKVYMKMTLTAPVSISYMSAPRDHQSTAFPWPLLVSISGALETNNSYNSY